MEEPPEKSSDPFIFQLSETVKGSTQAHFSTDDQHPIDDTPPKETHVIDQDSLSSNHSNSLTRLPVNIPTLVHGFSDGGFLEDKRMAAGWWLSVDNKIAHAKGTIVSWKSSSNNVAEYFGLIRALETALDRHHTHLAMNMDSLLVVQQLLGHWRCKNPILVELLQYARSLADQFTFFSIQHTLREGNTVADTLCNMAFDGFKGGLNDWKCALDRTTALHEVRASQASWNYQNISPNWDETWSIVMEELKAIGPMLRNMYLPGIPLFEEFIPPPPMSLPLTPEVKPIAVTGQPWPYVIEAAGLSEMKLLAAEANITWDHNRYRLLIPTVNTHGVKVLPYPTEDAQYTTAILAGINWDLPRLIRAWRGQTKMDPRPNKALDFSRITKSTVGYEKRKELEEIITHGYGLHWTAPHVGVRPLPKNQPSADANAEIMSAMILKQYKKGRLMVMNAEDVAKHVPQFATSPYGCVAKANKPLTHTCRPIHNQSAPVGSSINEGLDSSLRPDATWPGVSHIADRILDASTTYGASTLKAFVTDITDAFIQVGLADTDVQVNGGVLPLSNIATLATSCVFGNCESPAAFKILNCVPHIHRQLGSCVNGVNTPFDVRFYVDDGNAIEPDIGDRLKIAEASLRKSVTDVFGNDSIQEDKTSSWASSFTSLGYSWDLPSGTVSIPQEKLLRVKNELVRFSGLSTATVTEFRSLVGKLRHVATCCKPAGSLMQLLGGGLSAHKVSSGRQKKKITPAMRTELMWWASFLTPARFHNLPVEWLGTRENKVTNWLHCYSTPSVGVWLINQSEGSSQFTPWDSSLLRTVLKCLKSCLVNHHRSVRMTHTRILINECSIAKTLNRGSSPSHVVQDLLKSIGMWQLDHRHRITATTPSWEHLQDNDFGKTLAPLVNSWKATAIAESTRTTYLRNIKHWIMFCTEINLPSIWIDELEPSEQATVMVWFAVHCGSYGNNKKQEGNQYSTYLNKKAAVKWAHRHYRDAILHLDGASLVLVEAAYKRNQNCPQPKQPCTPQMLLRCHKELKSSPDGALAWGVLLLQYFFLGRGGEFWATDNARIGFDQAKCDHRIQWDDVILQDREGNPVHWSEPERAYKVQVSFNHAKADQAGRGDVITLGASGHPILCPVRGAIIALRSRSSWKPKSSTNALSGGIKSTYITGLLKRAAEAEGIDPKFIAGHSVRIGYATALFDAGYDELVIRLAGRWSSEAVARYTRVSGKVLLRAPRDVMGNVYI